MINLFQEHLSSAYASRNDALKQLKEASITNKPNRYEAAAPLTVEAPAVLPTGVCVQRSYAAAKPIVLVAVQVPTW
jgi:hypothetical protein